MDVNCTIHWTIKVINVVSLNMIFRVTYYLELRNAISHITPSNVKSVV